MVLLAFQQPVKNMSSAYLESKEQNKKVYLELFMSFRSKHPYLHYHNANKLVK